MDERAERRSRLVELYEQGLTYAQIGRAFGVERQRVHQMMDEFGIPRTPRPDRLYRFTTRGREAEIEALFLRVRDDEAVADATGIPVAVVRRLVDERVCWPDVLRQRPKRFADRYTDDELVQCLQGAALELPPPMAHATYAEWARGRRLPDGRAWPGPQAAMLRFRSWRAALARAGLPANPTAGPDPRFDLDDAVQAIVEAWRELDSPPTVERYDEWRASRAQYPGSSTARRGVSSWNELLLAAWPIVCGRPLPGVGTSEDAAEEPGADPAALTGVGIPYRAADEATAMPEADPFERDPQLLERAVSSHMRIQNELARMASDRGLEPLSPGSMDPEFDLAWRDAEGTLTIVEVKSATAANLESQLRLGLGQVLRYGEILRDRGEQIALVLAVELAPDDPVWPRLAERVGVSLVAAEDLPAAFAVSPG